MQQIVALLPAKAQPYAKAWVSFLGTIVITVVSVWPESPQWLVIVAAVLTTLGVRQTPNNDPQATHQDESTMPPGEPEEPVSPASK